MKIKLDKRVIYIICLLCFFSFMIYKFEAWLYFDFDELTTLRSFCQILLTLLLCCAFVFFPLDISNLKYRNQILLNFCLAIFTFCIYPLFIIPMGQKALVYDADRFPWQAHIYPLFACLIILIIIEAVSSKKLLKTLLYTLRAAFLFCIFDVASERYMCKIVGFCAFDESAPESYMHYLFNPFFLSLLSFFRIEKPNWLKIVFMILRIAIYIYLLYFIFDVYNFLDEFDRKIEQDRANGIWY